MFEVLSTSGDTHLGGDDFDKVGLLCLCSIIHLLLDFFLVTYFVELWLKLYSSCRES